MMKVLSRIIWVLGLASLACVAEADRKAIEVAGREVRLDIASQPLRTALTQFAQQAGVQLLFSEDEVPLDVNAPRLSGTYTVQTALEELLARTALKAQFINARTVAIHPGAAAHRTAGPLEEGGVQVAQDEADPGATSEKSSENTDKLDEIVVTAQKREERLLDVPVSVAVLNPAKLSAQGALQLRDFADTIPGVSLASSGAGNSQIVVRGLTLGQNTDPLPSTVTYVDDVPYGSSVGAGGVANFTSVDAALFDMQRIEVLKGPQGTLYGADAIGGVVKYVTQSPTTDKFGGQVQVGSASTRNGGVSYNAAASANIPIISEQLALRASGWYLHDGGYIRNLALSESDVNRSGIYGGRLDLLYTPSDKLSVRINAFLQNISRDGTALADYDLSGRPVDGPLDQRRPSAEPYDQHFRLTSATLSYDIDWARIASISSYQTIRQDFNTDISWEIPLFDPAFYGFTNGLSKIGEPSYSTTRKFTQEFRLSSEGHDIIEWIVGGFYEHEVTSVQQHIYFFDLDGQRTGNASADISYSEPVSFNEIAPFGTLTWHPTQQFDVSAGLRYSHSSQIVSQQFNNTGPYEKARSSENVFTYLGNARYHFNDRAVAYFRYATGYRPGGPNFQLYDVNTGTVVPQSPFKSDKLKTYELGFKSETVGRRFGIDASAFYYDWKDLQLYEFTPDFQGYTNATGGARIVGAELALTARPVDQLTLVSAVTFLDGRLRQAEPVLGGAENERLPNAARYSVNMSADYAFPADHLRPTLGANLSIIGDRKAGFDDGASVGVPPYRLPAYRTFDLHGGLTFGQVEMQLYIRNLFNEHGQLSAETYAAPYNGPVWVSVIQPRTAGLTLSIRF